MGEFTNGLVSKLMAVSLSVLVIAVNIYFSLDYVINLNISNAFFILFVVLVGLVYLLFCAYLTLDMVVTMSGSSALSSFPLIRSMLTINYSLYSDIDEEN